MSTVISVENLGKKYTLRHQQQESYTALRDVLTNGVVRVGKKILSPFTGDTPQLQAFPEVEDFWALKDVSFEVKQGDRIGIIGGNGAGKSTLLKILSRITEPTTGRVGIKGRVASLLEVGTGFHPELTGRENIYLNGAILGMNRMEIKKKFDEIVDFSEIEKFLDTPVKRYSSGMYVRLAFAVAAHLESEILIVDEVLAVGDAHFQKKCLGKMQDVSGAGRTVLFVSHNMGAVRTLCQLALLLKNGRCTLAGEVKNVIDSYLDTYETKIGKNGEIHWNNGATAPGGDECYLQAVKLLSPDGRPSDVFTADKEIRLEVSYKVRKALRGLRIVMHLLTREGEIAFASTDHGCQTDQLQPGLYTSICTLPGGLLNTRAYLVRIGVGVPGEKVLVYPQECLHFTVVGEGNQNSCYSEKWPGVVCPKVEWQVACAS